MEPQTGIWGLIESNQFLQGGLLITLVGGALVYLRQVPRQIGRWLQRQFTVTVHFREQDIVHWLGQWLAAGEYADKCRRLNCRLNHQDKLPTSSMEPGLGIHVFRYREHWIMLNHALEDEGEAATTLFEKKRTMTMWTMGRKSILIRQIVDDAIQLNLDRRKDRQVSHINYSGEYWQEVRADDKRPVESVVLADRDEIIDDADWFLNNSEWFTRRGIPYRRGYLFHGPPGNGKSTMIQVLAGKFELPIYMLSITGKGMGDSTLYGLMANVPRRAIVAIEDIDKVSFEKQEDEGITMTGLLNSIDGIVAGAGRILIITANDTTNLPAALLRPGRIDKEWFIDAPKLPQIEQIFNVFYPDANGQSSIFGEAVTGAEIPMAAIQQHMVKCRTPDEAVASVSDLVGA